MVEVESALKRTIRVLLPVSLQGRMISKNTYLGHKNGKVIYISINDGALTPELKDEIQQKYGSEWSDPEKYWSNSS